MAPDTVKIIYLIGQLGLGGSERQLALLLKHLDKTRFEPHVVVFNPSPNVTLEDDLRRDGVIVYEMPARRRGVLSRLVWLWQLLRRIRPRIVHSWTFYDNAYAALAGALARIPLRLGSLRGALNAPGFSSASLLARWLILYGVHGHVVNAQQAVDELRAAGVDPQRIFLLPNAVEIPSIPAHPLPPRRVGMVANLRREKNYPLFLRGLAKTLTDFPDVCGVMVGQAVLPYDPQTPLLIQAEIERLGLPGRLVQAGFQSDVSSFLAEWEIFCLTSDSEGTPNVVLEAMAAGLPVVATRVGGIPQVIEHDVTGLLIPPGDESALAAALRDLLSHPEKARRMGRAARERVEREFSPRVILPVLESYYQSYKEPQ